MQRLLRATDVAERLQVSTRYAYDLMRSGQMVTVRLGRSVRVTETDLDAFVESMRTDLEIPWYERMAATGRGG